MHKSDAWNVIDIYKERLSKIVYINDVSSLCAKPYAGHPKGCPNFGKRPTCPPNLAPLDAVIDVRQPVWVIGAKFNMAKHSMSMKIKHPSWSERQCECCLYWQGHVVSVLKKACAGYEVVLYVPEAYSVDISATVIGCGIKLQWPPKDYVWKIAFAGFKTTAAKGDKELSVAIQKPKNAEAPMTELAKKPCCPQGNALIRFNGLDFIMRGVFSEINLREEEETDCPYCGARLETVEGEK